MTIEFIPNAGACLVSTNITEGRGAIRFLIRDRSEDPADNGWRILSDVDTDEFLSTDGDPDAFYVPQPPQR